MNKRGEGGGGGGGYIGLGEECYLGSIFREDTHKMGSNLSCQLTESEPVTRREACLEIESWTLGIVRSTPWWSENDQIYGMI